ncbi:hypothetical protein [Niveibacterium sp. SC-1]|uniref:hypothetical protein n=1 Tax=Niveibacterium sp. SC-1 TaxID=3135646 RepID=UPI00311D9A3E
MYALSLLSRPVCTLFDPARLAAMPAPRNADFVPFRRAEAAPFLRADVGGFVPPVTVSGAPEDVRRGRG